MAKNKIDLSIFAPIAVGGSLVAIFGGNDMITFFFTLWIIGTQMLPYFAFKSYMANNKTLQLLHQRIAIIIAWFIVYVILPTIILKYAPAPEIIYSLSQPDALLQAMISGTSVNHNLRVMELLFCPDYFSKYNVQTPIQAVFTYNAYAIYHFKDISTTSSNNLIEQTISRIRGCLECLCLTIMDSAILRLIALFYHTYQSSIDSNWFFSVEVNMLYSLSYLTYVGNRMNWIIKLIYGDSIDIEMGYNYPALSRSIRDFWHRQSLFQRESLHNCVYEPVMRYTNNNGFMAVLCLFIVNCVLHATMSLQLQGDLFLYEWVLLFIISFIGTYSQVAIDTYFEKNNPKIMNTMIYKIGHYVGFHVLWTVTGRFKFFHVLPIGVQGSGYYLNHWI